jgi:hypothetical protein
VAKVVSSDQNRTISLKAAVRKLKIIIKYYTLDLTEDYKLVLGRRQMHDKMNKTRDKERGKAEGKSKRNKNLIKINIIKAEAMKGRLQTVVRRRR